ncbi:hypothetical protein MBLNU457_g0370t1 [Dothideomycetes sp. NU457]
MAPKRKPTPNTNSSPQHITLDWQKVLLSLIAFRVCNALVIRTFFQPDEYFQSLEPAWQLAFGNDSGAWITWEWREHLRSSIHPLLFSTVYKTTDTISSTLNLSPSHRADFLLAAPKVFQAVLAAATDFFTWRLAEKVYGHGDESATATLALTVVSPWQWFCSTRTLSNCLETTLTSAALYYWPWQNVFHEPHNGKTRLRPLRVAMCLAAFASILRPTNLIIWLVVTCGSLYLAAISEPNTIYQKLFVLMRELCSCGSVVLAISAISDRSFYGEWTFPPLRFLHFNVVQSLAVFYGRNRPDYYFTEGLPLLLTTALPFALAGLWSAFQGRAFLNEQDDKQDPPSVQGQASPFITSVVVVMACTLSLISYTLPFALAGLYLALRAGGFLNEQHSNKGSLTARAQASSLASAVIVMVCTLSVISHKEVRFIYPLLPILHILAGRPVWHFFERPSVLRRGILICLLAANLTLAVYTSLVHQRGVTDVLRYIRQEYEDKYMTASDGQIQGNMSVGFLMPCHSTPWRSHLIWPHIDAWALTCEPPLDIPMTERASYLDEADQFYEGPKNWLTEHMVWHESTVSSEQRQWPEYVAFFQQLEPTMKEYLAGSSYHECWRGFNSHFHDDWRRKGDVIVWCLGE